MTRPDPRRLARARTESDFERPAVEHEYELNTPLKVGRYVYYYRGHWTNPYGIVSYYGALSPTGVKLVKFGPTRTRDMRVATNEEIHAAG